MATFDFDHAPERLGTRCVKWDSIGEGELPMWVADMDFEVAPAKQRRDDPDRQGRRLHGRESPAPCE